MYRARLTTDEWLECENFKNLYNAAVALVQSYLEWDELHNAYIEVDGEDKYRIAPTIWFRGAECLGKSIEVIRLTDWNFVTARDLAPTNQAAKRCMTKYLNRLTEPPEKEDLERTMTSIANRFAKDRKSFDKLMEELNQICYNC